MEEFEEILGDAPAGSFSAAGVTDTLGVDSFCLKMLFLIEGMGISSWVVSTVGAGEAERTGAGLDSSAGRDTTGDSVGLSVALPKLH